MVSMVLSTAGVRILWISLWKYAPGAAIKGLQSKCSKAERLINKRYYEWLARNGRKSPFYGPFYVRIQQHEEFMPDFQGA
jgi:hypothetical protein